MIYCICKRCLSKTIRSIAMPLNINRMNNNFGLKIFSYCSVADYNLMPIDVIKKKLNRILKKE